MPRRRGASIPKVRGGLYFLARLLGDVQAVRRHRVIRRVHNRLVGRLIARSIRRLFI